MPRCINVSDVVSGAQACPPGLVSAEDRVDCRLCPAGFSCDPDQGVLLSVCPTGQHSPQGVLHCLPCPLGSICSTGYPQKVGETEAIQITDPYALYIYH